jgi:hypothetical protein
MLETDSTWQDPCLSRTSFSLFRFSILALLFLTLWTGIFALILLSDRPFGTQLCSIVVYTAAVALYTFSRNRNGNQPFLLSCPIVRNQLPSLTRRYISFVAALFIIQTTSLSLRSNLPTYWTTPISGTEPTRFAVILCVLCACLAIVHILTNRSLLDRAHLAVNEDS